MSKLSLLGEASSLRIDGMPHPSPPASVLAMLHEIDLDVDIDDIAVSIMPQSTAIVAHIRFSDPRSASTGCKQLTAWCASEQATSTLTARVVVPKLPGGSTVRRISCNKVIISWYRPTRLVWLNFGAQRVAMWVSEKFNGSRYTPNGRNINASIPKLSGTPGHVSWTVVLQGVPSSATEMNIRPWFSAMVDQPRHIELGKVTTGWTQKLHPR